MGRPRKPTVLKIVTGNPGKRPLNTSEPRPNPAAPRCPSWLSKEAKARWKTLAPELSRLGLLTSIDGDTLAAYCQAWAEFRWATETLEREGRAVVNGGHPATSAVTGETVIIGGQVVPHPAVAQQRSAWKAMQSFAALFGLDPSSRSKLKGSPDGAGDDPFEALMRKKKG